MTFLAVSFAMSVGGHYLTSSSNCMHSWTYFYRKHKICYGVGLTVKQSLETVVYVLSKALRGISEYAKTLAFHSRKRFSYKKDNNMVVLVAPFNMKMTLSIVEWTKHVMLNSLQALLRNSGGSRRLCSMLKRTIQFLT